jgi:hypothetical protein
MAFCFEFVKEDGYTNFLEKDDSYELLVFRDHLEIVRNDILFLRYDFNAKKLEYYFNEIILEDIMLQVAIDEIFALIGYNRLFAIKQKPKISDVFSFLTKRKLSSVKINYEAIEHLRSHGIICMGFKDGM